jgi:hypothetical protein
MMERQGHNRTFSAIENTLRTLAKNRKMCLANIRAKGSTYLALNPADRQSIIAIQADVILRAPALRVARTSPTGANEGAAEAGMEIDAMRPLNEVREHIMFD